MKPVRGVSDRSADRRKFAGIVFIRGQIFSACCAPLTGRRAEHSYRKRYKLIGTAMPPRASFRTQADSLGRVTGEYEVMIFRRQVAGEAGIH
jgi:hypothetical protein